MNAISYNVLNANTQNHGIMQNVRSTTQEHVNLCSERVIAYDLKMNAQTEPMMMTTITTVQL